LGRFTQEMRSCRFLTKSLRGALCRVESRWVTSAEGRPSEVGPTLRFAPCFSSSGGRMTRFSLFFVVCALALPPAFVGDRKPPQDKNPPGNKKALGDKKGFFEWIQSKVKGKASALRKYEDVITKEAKTQEGVFKVHRIEDRLYFEIPKT